MTLHFLRSDRVDSGTGQKTFCSVPESTLSPTL